MTFKFTNLIEIKGPEWQWGGNIYGKNLTVPGLGVQLDWVFKGLYNSVNYKKEWKLVYLKNLKWLKINTLEITT